MIETVNNGPERLWDNFLQDIRPSVSNHVFDTWLRPIRCTSLRDDVITLEVRDPFFRDWLVDHYIDVIRDGLARIIGTSVGIDWALNPALGTTSSDMEEDERSKEDGGEEEEEDKDKEPLVSEWLLDSQGRLRLNPRYTFGSFVAGPSNQFAYAACMAAAENPGTSYNPLFLFGGVGLGKTHLLTAIAHAILQRKPRTNIVYASAEQFTNEVINAVLGSKLTEFRSKYRKCDALLIDDIQLIAGKERTQHEFFHVFNVLHNSQRQIVVTSDKLPHEIPEIEERLRSRFQWGLIADVQPPEIETRIAIVRKKAASEGLQLNADVSYFLARSIRSNVRELEGALVRLLAHASITKTPITVEYARSVLVDILNSRAQKLSVEAIQKAVATYFQVRVSDLKSRRRLKALVRPRQVAMYLCRKHTESSFPELGSRFGDKDHTTIMSACNKVEGLLREDHALRGQVLDLERQLDVFGR